MKVRFNKLIAVGSAILLASPLTAWAFESQFTETYDGHVAYCVANHNITCVNDTLDNVALVRANTDDNQYAEELAAYVMAIVEVWENNDLDNHVCDRLAEVLEEISLSSLDEDQAKQIVDIADIVRQCGGSIGTSADRLLASPN